MILQEQVLDWKSYLAMSLDLPTFKHITDHHAFRVGKAQNGNIQLLYKEWRRDEKWNGSFQDSSGVTIFQSHILQSVKKVCPKFVHYSKQVDSSVSDTITKVVKCLRSGNTDNSSRISWFEKFLTIPSTPQGLPVRMAQVLSPVASIPEELQEPPVPDHTQAPARPIIPQPPRLDPQLFSNRDPRVGELVVIEMHPDDRRQWATYSFWIAKVLRCPTLLLKGYQVLWYYKKQDGSYQESKPDKKNVWEVKRETILFSGFQLTSTQKMYAAHEKLFIEHEKIKQFL
jgi:hypothetical protein